MCLWLHADDLCVVAVEFRGRIGIDPNNRLDASETPYLLNFSRWQMSPMSPMNEENAEIGGVDLAQGIEILAVPDGSILLGHARGETVLLIRRGDEIFALGATCTHYGAPLVSALLVGGTVRCPWHHACFSVATGEAIRAPALNPLSCWRVEQRAGIAYVKKGWNAANRRCTGQPLALQARSLSSEVVRRAMPQRKRFGVKAIPATSQC